MVHKIKVDCHVHSHYSGDCKMSLADIISTCGEKNIACIAVTDHNTIQGAMELKNRTPELKIIVGEEINTTAGEIIGLFLSEEIKAGMSPEATICAIKNQGGLVCIPHPFDRLRKSAIHTDTLMKIINDVDIIEIFNARNIFSADDKKAHSYAASHKKRFSVGSDAHTTMELGQSHIIMNDFDTPRDFLIQMEQGELHMRHSSLLVHFHTKFTKMCNSCTKLLYRERGLSPHE